MQTLTTKQRWFANAMATTSNIEQAAKVAEISLEQAEQWLVHPDIEPVILHDKIAAINTAMETRDRVISRYANIANADLSDYYVKNSNMTQLRDIGDLTVAQRQCIKSVKFTPQGDPILELYDRMRANDKLADILKVVSDDVTGASAEEKASQIRTLLQEMEDVTTGVTTH